MRSPDMDSLLAPGHVWMVAAGVSLLTLAQAVRSVVSQGRRSSRAAREEAVWTLVATAARRIAVAGPPDRTTLPDREAEDLIVRALQQRRTRALALDALASAARTDRRIPRSLRGRTRLVQMLRRTVVAQLQDKEPGRRAAAAELVATLRLRSCAGAIAAATSDPDATVRVAACRCLARLDPQQALGVLLGLAETDGAWAADLLTDVARRLQDQGAGDAVTRRASEWAVTPAMVRLLRDQQPTTRGGAIMRKATQAQDVEVRVVAAEALGRDPDPESVDTLIDLLGDDEERVRLNAVRALGGLAMISSRVALRDLSAMLADESRRVRFAAGAALADLPGGSELLAHSADSADPRVREAVAMALWVDSPQPRQSTVRAITRPGARRSA